MRRGILSGKKGLSEIIGYVLLISITMILSVIVYQWIKTYVPKDTIECDDGVSIFVDSYDYDCDAKTLELTLKNSGRFDVAGYFIHATTSETQELAVTDLSETTANGDGGAVNRWEGGTDLNPISAGDIMTDIFDLTNLDSSIFSIQLVPLRYEEIDGRNRPAACSNAKITQKISCTTGILDGGGSCNGAWNSPEDTGVVCDGGYKCIVQGQSNQCTCQVGYEPDGIGGCIGNIVTLFYDGFNDGVDPEDNGKGWSVGCGVSSCNADGNNPDNEVYSASLNSCNIDVSSCGEEYMVTERNWFAYLKTPPLIIDTANFKDFKLSYYRRSQDTEGNDRLRVDWRIGSSSSWTPIENVPANPTISTWSKNEVNLNGISDGQEIQVRFWLNGGNNGDKGLWDNITISGKRI